MLILPLLPVMMIIDVLIIDVNMNWCCVDVGLQYQVEVRSLSDRIADFQKKLEVVSALAEPRENCYLIYEIQVKRLFFSLLCAILSGFSRVSRPTIRLRMVK